MSTIIPTTQDQIDANLAAIEGRLNLSTPPGDRAYNRVLATVQGMQHTTLYKYAGDRIAANFAQTAVGADLDEIGAEYDLPRNLATAAVVTATLPADDGTTIPLGTLFAGPQGYQYQVLASVTAPSGVSGSGVVLSLACLTAGTGGNIATGSTLAIVSSIAGAGTTATVTATTTTAADDETDDVYRVRVLDLERAMGGGGNSADYRTWAESIPNVKRAYPFSGPYVGSGLTAIPGMRTVYVEALPAYATDGIPDSTLLASVLAALLADPDTSESRLPLGLTSDYLYVRPIIRTPIYVQVTGLAVTSGTIAAAESAITTTLTTYFLGFSPFVQGLDPDFDRLDTVTQSLLARAVQDVLDAYGGTAQSVLFGLSVGSFLGTYTVANNETLKLGGIVWA